MKKIFIIIMIVVMLVSSLTIHTFAEENGSESSIELHEELDTCNLYDTIFKDTFGMGTGYEYDEKYYHKSSDDEVEWCLVYAINTPGPPAPFYTVLTDYVSLQGGYIPFSTMYGIYDAMEKKFYDLIKLESFDKYEGLVDQLLSYDKYMYPIGDADKDRKLTIMDATFIQRVEAELCTYNESIDDLRNRFVTPGSEKIAYISDIDGDGERSVMDATAIQMKLAEIEDTTPTEQ